MIFARAMAIACLKVLGWLLFITAALLAVVIVMNWRDGDPQGKLVLQGGVALAFVVGGFVSLYFARFFEKM